MKPLFVNKHGISTRNYYVPVVAAIELVEKAPAETPIHNFLSTGCFVVPRTLIKLPKNNSC